MHAVSGYLLTGVTIDAHTNGQPRSRSSMGLSGCRIQGDFLPITPAINRCSVAAAVIPAGAGPSRAATGLAATSLNALVADGETVVDVPSKLSARIRVFATGQGRKTDPVDAHSVAVVGLPTTGLRRIQADGATVALGLLVDHRDELGRARSQTVNRLHRPLLELVPGGAKRGLAP
jgi:hypothetical protein